MEKKKPIEEARRYVANAKEVIQKANYDPELKIYTDGKYVKMVDAGILDPVKVTRSALQNATSVASTFLTTEAVVALNTDIRIL